MTVFRCSACRVIVDVGTSAALSCAACGGSLTPSESAATSTVWDDDEPTERRPASWVKELEQRR